MTRRRLEQFEDVIGGLLLAPLLMVVPTLALAMILKLFN